jgi:hypothetical protein
MGPEILVLFVALLWGPTALWLMYRTIRGHRGRLPRPFDAASERTRSWQPAPDEPDWLVDSSEYWVCGTCNSLNRRAANHCYRCKARKSAAGGQVPDEQPVSPGVPVMASGIARSSGEQPVSPGVPVMASGIARSSDEVPGTTATLATPRIAPPAPEILAGAPEQTLSVASTEAPAGVAVCPFLEFRDDPSARHDSPDPGNRCQVDLFSQPVGVEHQKSYCLRATHTRCTRYRANEVVPTSR